MTINILLRPMGPEMTERGRDYSKIDKSTDNIENLVSVLLSDEKDSLEWQYSVKLLYRFALPDGLCFLN